MRLFVVGIALASAMSMATVDQAEARCASGNPHDPRCSPRDFLGPAHGDTGAMMNNQVMRRGTIIDCTQYRVIRPVNCSTAWQADRLFWGWYGR